MVGRALSARVPTEVRVASVAIVLAVGFVVLVVVRDEIAQREPVVRGHEIERRPDVAAAMPEGFGRTAQARGEIGEQLVVALPKPAHASAKPVVPLRPTRRK